MSDVLSSNPYAPFSQRKRRFSEPGQRAPANGGSTSSRMERMVSENEAELQNAVKLDFKTASQEYVFDTQAAVGEVAFQRSHLDDWMKPVEAPVPNALAATGHRALV